MKWLIAFLALNAVAGCAVAGERRLAPAERERCIKAANEWDLIIIGGVIDCREFGPKHVFKGVWFDGFEESGFIEGVKTVPLIRDLDGGHGSFATNLFVPAGRINQSIRRPPIRNGCTMAIYVEFVGRKAVRRIPREIEGEEPLFKVERVLASHYLGRVSSTLGGKMERDCR